MVAEIINLGEFDPIKNRRDFDAVSGGFFWSGRIDFELWGGGEGRIYVYSDRHNILDDDFGVRPGELDEVRDDEFAKRVIARAIEQCFDHTTTVKAISNGNGGWITLETDT